VSDAKGLALGALRLIGVVVDMRAGVLEWQQALGHVESGVTDTLHGLVGGKTFTWMSRSDGSSACAVVLINAQLLPDLVAHSPWAVAALVHELAHVHEGCLLRSPDPRPNCYSGDIPGIRHTFAAMVWEEYFAERFAASWLGEDDLDPHSCLLLSQEKHERVQELRSNLYDGRNVAQFWNSAVTHLGYAAQGIGRALGRFANKPEAFDKWMAGLSFGLGWRGFALDAAGILNRLYLNALDRLSPDTSGLATLIPRLWEEHGVRWDESHPSGCRIWIADRDGVWRL
jgi:hypothetical protein